MHQHEQPHVLILGKPRAGEGLLALARDDKVDPIVRWVARRAIEQIRQRGGTGADDGEKR